MKRLAFLALAVFAISPAAAMACVAAGHGGPNCQAPSPPDTSQHCFVGKERLTPKVGSAYTLDVTAAIEPTIFPGLFAPCTGRAVSAWVMSAANSVLPGEQNSRLIQVGYWEDCNWNGHLYYFQTYYDGTWHNSWAGDWTGGAHNFSIHRDAGTNVFHSLVDGNAWFAPVTVVGSYARQLILAENTVPNSGSAVCNSMHFRFQAIPTGPPGQYQFPWYESTATDIYPGMHFTDTGDYGNIDVFDGSDWAH